MNASVIVRRAKLVSAMHQIVIYMNDELAYSEWIVEVPDQPSEIDFVDIAEDDEGFDSVCRLFSRLMRKYAKHGFYIEGELY